MSLILDALRKSEQERRQADPLVLSPIGPEAAVLPRRRWGALPIVAAVVVAGVALGGYWFVASRLEVSLAGAGSAVKPNESRASSTAPLPAQGDISSSSAARPAPEFTPSPFVAAASQKGAVVRDLAKEARVEPREPAPAAAPKQEQVALAAPTPVPAPPPSESIKFLRAMPPEFQRALPELVVNIHIYAPREADRILYINNRQYHAGDKVRDDLVVQEIVEDGAVLRYRGQLFKLARPS